MKTKELIDKTIDRVNSLTRKTETALEMLDAIKDYSLENLKDRVNYLEQRTIDFDNWLAKGNLPPWLSDRLFKLEQEVILLKDYKGHSIKKLEEIYNISIRKVLPVEVIDNIEIAVFQMKNKQIHRAKLR